MLKHFVVNLNLFILHNIPISFAIIVGFNFNTEQRNHQSIINDNILGKLVLDNSNNYYVFAALNFSKIIATIDNDAHIRTKIEYIFIDSF